LICIGLEIRAQRVFRLGIAGRALVGLQLADDHAVLVDDGLALVAALAGNLARLFLAGGLLFFGSLEQILFLGRAPGGFGICRGGGKNGHTKAGRAEGSKKSSHLVIVSKRRKGTALAGGISSRAARANVSILVDRDQALTACCAATNAAGKDMPNRVRMWRSDKLLLQSVIFQ
jgi:hypothetical protein